MPDFQMSGIYWTLRAGVRNSGCSVLTSTWPWTSCFVSPEANLQAEGWHRIAFHHALESILVWSQGEKKALCHQLCKTHPGLAFFGVGEGAVTPWQLPTFSSCPVIQLEPKVGQTFCPLCRCPCEPQCSDQTLHLRDCMQEVDLDIQKCKEFPSLLSCWLEGTKATWVPAQSFTACLPGDRTVDRRAGSHFCSSDVVIPFAREETSSQNKKKYFDIPCVWFFTVLLEPGEVHVSAVSEEWFGPGDPLKKPSDTSWFFACKT